MINNEVQTCPAVTTINIIRKKWRICILQVLFVGNKRFGEIRKEFPQISQKVLTYNLRTLEKEKLVERIIYATIPPKVEYMLSDLGRTLCPIIDDMYNWGKVYEKEVNAVIDNENDNDKNSYH